MLNIIEVVDQAKLNTVINYVSNKKHIGLDLETRPKQGYEWYKPAGLDPHTSDVVMFQIGDTERQYVIDTRKVDITPLKDILENPLIPKYGVNLKFDASQLLANYGIHVKGLQDCMIYEMLLHQGKDTPKGFYGLEQMSERYLGYKYSQPEQTSLFPEMTLYKNLRKQFHSIGDKPFSKALITYGATDVLLPLLIAKKQGKLLRKLGMETLARLECKFTEVLARMEVKGFYLDQDLWLDNADMYEKQLEIAEQKLREYISTYYPVFKEINFNSPKQVSELFLTIGIPIEIIDKDKSTEEELVYKHTVAETHIAKYKKEYDILPLYIEYKHLTKLVGTYGHNWLQYINPVTGRVHSSYYQILNTGRISSGNPNLQNVPTRGEKIFNDKGEEVGFIAHFRRCFNALPGKDLIICDYSGQESRVLAEFSQEPNMIDFFNHGDGDMHSFTASRMFEKPVSKKINKHLRQVGKVLNFSIAYGASAHKIADSFQVDMKTAQGFINKFYKAYPYLKTYFKLKQSEVLEKGYIVIDRITNRRSYCRHWEEFQAAKNLIEKFKRYGWSKHIPSKVFATYYKLKGEYQRNAQNYPIQGASGSMTKIAAVLFDQWVWDQNLQDKIFIVNQVHDEIVVEAAKDVSNLAADKLGECMVAAGQLFIEHLPVVATPVKSDYWTH